MKRSKDVINVLTIDGGGIRGLMSAEILVYVEKALRDLYGRDTKIADHFDYIAGTSTGGILTCLYVFPGENGMPKYSAQDASNFYFNHGSEIFKKKMRWALTFGGMLGPRYGTKTVENLFERYFGSTTIKEAIVPFMVTSVATDKRDPYLFKSYKGEKLDLHNKTFTEAALSTSAAPTYFKPNRLALDYGTEVSLIDGGLGINNPSMSALIEIFKMHPNVKKINTLSIGTGPTEKSYSYETSRKWGVITGASKLFDIVLTSMSDIVNYQVEKLYDSEKIEGEFLRVQPHIYFASSKIDDASKKNLKLLREAGQKSVEDHKAQIDKFLANSFN